MQTQSLQTERQRARLEIDKKNFLVEMEAGLKSYVVRQVGKCSWFEMYFITKKFSTFDRRLLRCLVDDLRMNQKVLGYYCRSLSGY